MTFSIYNLKPAFVALLRPLASRLFARSVTANHVTVAAAAFSLIYGGLLLLWPDAPLLWFGLPVWLFLRMAMNAVDGILAREHGQKSRLGGLLNECGDVVADAALFAPLALVPGVLGWLVALFIWLALTTEYAGTLGPLIGAERRYDGPMGKSDRAFCIGAAGLAMGFAIKYNVDISRMLNFFLLPASLLMLLTAYNRMKRALESPAGHAESKADIAPHATDAARWEPPAGTTPGADAVHTAPENTLPEKPL